MRLVATSSVDSGAKLARAIYSDNGQILVNQGVELRERTLQRLGDLGVAYIYVDDKETEDINISEPISNPLRKEAMSKIISTFKEVQSQPFSSRTFVLEKSVKQFKDLIHSIMSELKEKNELLSILSDVYTHDSYIFTHSLNVTLYSLAVGMEMKLPKTQLEVIGLGAIMHDIGKMMIPEEILLKPGRLTEDEFSIIKQHSEEGFEILRKLTNVPLLVAHCAYQHHERLNGTGYPRGIKGDEIHDYAKIIAVSDVFDAVTSNRVYRPAMLPHEGLEMLYAGANELFKQDIVRAFQKAVAIYPLGITVELNDGRKGVVAKQNVMISDRPIVRILEEDGKSVHPYEIDLSTELSIIVTGCDTTFK
jgi:putative nucleotidyltransferase with HDIG domain